MASEKKSFLLRIPQELWDEIARLAAADLRSVNAEIEFMLRDAVSKRRNGKAPPSKIPEDDTRVG